MTVLYIYIYYILASIPILQEPALFENITSGYFNVHGYS